MDSDQESYCDEENDSGNVSTDENDENFAMDVDVQSSRQQNEQDNYPFEVLTSDEIVKHMVDCIKEVNTVLEMPATTTRILLNFFRWDKEKLMERFYDGDQDQLFRDAHVINPFKKPISCQKAPKVIHSSS